MAIPFKNPLYIEIVRNSLIFEFYFIGFPKNGRKKEKNSRRLQLLCFI